jgi:hypothetical protein
MVYQWFRVSTSNTSPKDVFVRTFHEHASLGSLDKPLLVCRGLLATCGKPTMNSEYKFIVATPAIFIGGGAPDWSMANLYENASFNVGADRGTAVPPAATSMKQEVAAQGDSGHTRCSHIPPRPPFSFVVVKLKTSWTTLLLVNPKKSCAAIFPLPLRPSSQTPDT